MKSSKLRRVLLLLASAVLLVSLSVGATLAYLTDTDKATNTFTVGQVGIKLDEANVDEYGDKIDETRVTENKYHLMPGFEYIKDPTIWIDEGSEKAWIWAKIVVTVDPDDADSKGLNALRKQLAYDNSGLLGLDKIVKGGVFGLEYTQNADSANKWYSTDGTIRLEQYAEDTQNIFYVYFLKVQDEKVDNDLVLFEKLTVPHEWDNDEIKNLNNTKIDITAYAIQADGFASVDDAQIAFDRQNTDGNTSEAWFSEADNNWTKQEAATGTGAGDADPDEQP